ncbi:MAG: glycerophosphodiester phosphodiesterase [Ruminococcaceae bacterium]|nr:glycerophosphodiester phosphodiesterase [Oscillospiraceae bacterium]
MAECNVIAHRGANIIAPQNTIEAFRMSMEIGCDGFETDIHLTKDGIPVICHNFTIDETSNGTGAIKDMTLEELRQLDFGSYKGAEYEGVKIPTLDEFLELSKSMGDKMKFLDIELKSEHFGEAGTELAEKTIDAVKNHGLFDKLLISSFDPAILVVCKKIDKNCKTGILYAPDKLIGMKIAPRPVAFAKEIGADALHPYYMLVTRLYVERAHRAGLQVNPWTVNKESVAKKLIKYGVDGLITDDSALMNTLLGK